MLNTFYQKRKRKLSANLKECERVYQSCKYPIILTQCVQHLKNRIDGIPIATEVLLMESYNTWLRIFIVFWYMQRSAYACVCVYLYLCTHTQLVYFRFVTQFSVLASISIVHTIYICHEVQIIL